MKFEINDSVSVIDDAINGIVLQVKEETVTIETTDGFLMEFSKNKLVKIATGEIHFKGIGAAIAQKESFKKKPKRTVKPKERDHPAIIFDLHIEKLVKSKQGLSNFDMLSLQLDTAKQQLDFAIRKGIQKIVLVHGVGEGVLKADLYSMLRRYDNIKFYDADNIKYGQGATEIYIFQNISS
jgi:dsDNA-specific endonuclease/ATPase MutS2